MRPEYSSFGEADWQASLFEDSIFSRTETRYLIRRVVRPAIVISNSNIAPTLLERWGIVG